MYGDQPIVHTVVARATIPARYVCVQGSGTDGGAMATAVTQNLLGIAQNEPLAGEHLSVCMLGMSRAVAGAAVAAWAEVTTNASGRLVTAASGDCVIGTALEAAAADGDLFKVLVQRMRKTPI